MIQKQVTSIHYKVPAEFKDLIKSWSVSKKSPHSFSYYNTLKKNWGVNPLGHLRISDHWNFKSHGMIHCVTDKPVRTNAEWALAKWDGEKYVVLKVLPSCSILELRTKDLLVADHATKSYYKGEINRLKNLAAQLQPA